VKESETEPEESLPEESLPEETKPEETLPETTAAAAKQKVKEKEYLTMEDIAGTWTIDEITTYSFKADGTGALILPKNKYSFKNTLEEDEMKIDFENNKLRDSTFKVSLTDEVLTLKCLDEYFENEYELHKLEE